MKLRPVDYNSEKCRVIDSWKKRVLDPTDNYNVIDRSYLIAAMTIFELCVKDVLEQTYSLFIPPDRDGERKSYDNLMREHDVIYLNNTLRKITDEEYYFPPLPDELDARNMEKVLYEDINLDIDKEKVKTLVEAYMRIHNELLEDYEQRWYKLKLEMSL